MRLGVELSSSYRVPVEFPVKLSRPGLKSRPVMHNSINALVRYRACSAPFRVVLLAPRAGGAVRVCRASRRGVR